VNTEHIKKGPGRPSLHDVLGILDEEVALLRERLGGLPRAVEADHILREIWIDDVHNSTAIEGNTMTRAQVEDVVERRQAPSTSVVEIMDVEGYARAADWVYSEAANYDHVPLAVVSEIHKIAIGLAWQFAPPVTRDSPGAWRQGPVRVGAVKVASPAAIPAELDAWSASTRDAKDYHSVIHAAIHHAWFERIHPFVDGNGRVGRLLLNFMLIQRGYPPAVILATQRRAYLKALRLADGDNPNALAEVIARAVSGALTKFLIPKLAGEAKLVPLSALAAQSPYSVEYLRTLIDRKKLRAMRHGRLWLSSRAWLDDYRASRDPRGGEPRGKKWNSRRPVRVVVRTVPASRRRRPPSD
jgi:cell filamentation protein, protein adenylyltransferase